MQPLQTRAPPTQSAAVGTRRALRTAVARRRQVRSRTAAALPSAGAALQVAVARAATARALQGLLTSASKQSGDAFTADQIYIGATHNEGTVNMTFGAASQPGGGASKSPAE